MYILFTLILAFISTNIDDIFILMMLLAQVANKKSMKNICIGQYLGISILMAVSLMGVCGLQCVSRRYIALLGLIPITLGIKEWLEYKRENQDDGAPDDKEKLPVDAKIINVMLLAVANGADNIGVYVPLFAGYEIKQIVVAWIVFMLMTGLWCFLGYKMAGLPWMKCKIQKYKHMVVPAVFILLGICIIVENIV